MTKSSQPPTEIPDHTSQASDVSDRTEVAFVEKGKGITETQVLVHDFRVDFGVEVGQRATRKPYLLEDRIKARTVAYIDEQLDINGPCAVTKPKESRKAQSSINNQPKR